MYICLASSDSFSMYAGIAMSSFLRHNVDMDIKEVFILDFDISNRNKELLQTEATKYLRKLTFVPANNILKELASKCGIDSFRGSLATYSRVFIEYLVPDYVDKLFFIDSDTVTVGPALDLESINCDKKCVYGVIQSSWFNRKPMNEEFRILGGERLYVNCGMLLYNLKMWKDNNISEFLLKSIDSNANYAYADQSIINSILPTDYIGTLHPKFNYMGHVYPVQREMHETNRGGWYSKEIYEESMESPVIIHYPGISPKPWYNESISRRVQDYLDAKALTVWKDVAQQSLKEEIKTKYPSRKKRWVFWFSYWKSTIKSPFLHDMIQKTISNLKLING